VVDLVEDLAPAKGAERMAEVGLDESEPRVCGGEVLATARREIVDHRDRITSLQKTRREVRANEPGAAGHEHAACVDGRGGGR
jgi:hypothetical protein